MRKVFEYGGFAAAAILIAFGAVAIVMGFDGRSTVQSSLKTEQIVGTPDMTPAAITAEAKKAGLSMSVVKIPSKSVAGVKIDNGARARTFAEYMRIHTQEATGGLTYSQMGRYLAKPGTAAKLTDGHGGTNDTASAVIDPKTTQPVDNGARNIWVTETALTTALNTSFLASQLALFSIVVGFALLLTGIGFLVLAVGGALRHTEAAVALKRKQTSTPAKLAPTA